MNTITYVMSHPAHLPYLVVSLRSLRRHWSGTVYVHAWNESINIVECIAADARLGGIRSMYFDPEHKGKNAQFECKQHVIQSMVDDHVLYLDADTMIAGDLSPLFNGAKQCGFMATQFNEWNTQGRIMQGRIKRLRPFSEIDQEAVEEVLKNKWPSLNGGIFCCRPDSPVLDKWIKWTKMVRKIFISDETALHALMPSCMADGTMGFCKGGAFNCSPKYQPKLLRDEDVRVWHFHGDCNVRPQKNLRAVKIWWPEYQACLRENIGGLADWRKSIKHKHLNRLEDALKDTTCWQRDVLELAVKK